jgi:acyl-CoA thioesterase II
MSQKPLDLSGIFELEPHGPDTYVGESPPYEWGRIYGGLVVAQALWAATYTVQPEHQVHSLHAYFILGGNPTEPVRYEVDRLRNGKSFTTRQVVARQSGGAILNLSASFQRHEDGPDVSSVQFPTDVPPPERCKRLDWAIGLEARLASYSRRPPRSCVWCRYSDPIGDEPALHEAALAYLSDSNPMDAIRYAHPEHPDVDDPGDFFMGASLDHALWFHRAVRADQWLLFEMRSHQLIGTRGLATGDVFTQGGVLVATVAQQGLVRVRRAPA